jgi:hypothetical protein
MERKKSTADLGRIAVAMMAAAVSSREPDVPRGVGTVNGEAT